MKKETTKLAGTLLVVLPTVAYGGISLLTFLINRESGYVDNPLRQDLFRAGHAHAGVLLVLSLVLLRYVDEAKLPGGLIKFARVGTPMAALLIPGAFFFSVLDPKSTEPNGLIYLAYAGFVVLLVTLVTLGIGLIRASKAGD